MTSEELQAKLQAEEVWEKQQRSLQAALQERAVEKWALMDEHERSSEYLKVLRRNDDLSIITAKLDARLQTVNEVLYNEGAQRHSLLSVVARLGQELSVAGLLHKLPVAFVEVVYQAIGFATQASPWPSREDIESAALKREQAK